MANLRESFPTLENTTTEEGVALGARIEGQSSAGVNGAIGFAFKDVDGNVVLPQLNAQGQVPVTMEQVGNNLYARGENAGSATEVLLATIALATSKTYEDIFLQVSCFRDTEFRLTWNNNGVETELAAALVGPGSLTFGQLLEGVEFTSGATGTQQLKIYGQNQNALSTMKATIAVKEII
jgi:hypothetical protein